MYHTLVKLISINGKLMKKTEERFHNEYHSDGKWTSCSYSELKNYVQCKGTKVEWL